VAKNLEFKEGEEEKRKKWARALIDDAQTSLRLELEENKNEKSGEGDSAGDGDGNGSSIYENDDVVMNSQNENGNGNNPMDEMSAARAVSELSEHDVMDAMEAARTILLDVEDALLSISEDDAEEIADVGIVVAKMFLWGVQNLHSQITPNMIQSGLQQGELVQEGNGLDVEILDENGHATGQTLSSLADGDANARRQTHKDRLRILWPPIGPAVGSMASWGKDSATQNPILSIALGMTLWPAAVIAAFIGAPILAADWCLQSGYEAIRDHNVVEMAEISAANLFHVSRFYFLVSKLTMKQSIRFVKRQVNRRGGAGKIAQDVGGWTLDRALHPMESVGMMWNSAKWSVDKVVEGVEFIKNKKHDENIARDVIN
jgi:hypothetical protein